MLRGDATNANLIVFDLKTHDLPHLRRAR